MNWLLKHTSVRNLSFPMAACFLAGFAMLGVNYYLDKRQATALTVNNHPS